MAASIDACSPMVTMTVSVALRRNNRIKRCTVECCLSLKVAESIAASRRTMASAVICGSVARSCVIDGEVVILDDEGRAVFDLLQQGHRIKPEAILFAFDLLELDGQDLKREPLFTRKATLLSLLKGAPHGILYNEHMDGDGAMIFEHACKLGCEGIVSKRADSPYRSTGRGTGLRPSHRRRLRCRKSAPRIGISDRVLFSRPKLVKVTNYITALGSYPFVANRLLPVSQ
jgi:hypothetical protein